MLKEKDLIPPGCQTQSSSDTAFEEKYIRVRSMENRIYTNEEVMTLPFISKKHPHYREWRVRQRSCRKLMEHFRKKRQPLKILEVGCGNGWLCHQLSTLPSAIVIGLDINFMELKQAAGVFRHRTNLHFIYGNIRSGLFAASSFDAIVFAASIQYFPLPAEIMEVALTSLKPAGEIHIIDSAFYERDEVAGARERSRTYYQRIGYPEMADHYYHHSFDGLSRFQYRLLGSPTLISRVFSTNRHPFPWICIKKNSCK